MRNDPWVPDGAISGAQRSAFAKVRSLHQKLPQSPAPGRIFNRLGLLGPAIHYIDLADHAT